MSQITKLDKEKVKLEGPFAEEILATMKRLGMRRLEEFADTFGLGRTTVYNLVLGRKVGDKWIKPSLDTVVKLSAALDIPVEELIAKLYEDEVPILRRHEAHIPILGYVGGGPPQLEEIGDRTVPVRVKGSASHLVAFKVRGNSMCAGRRPICDGDIIIVNTQDKGHPRGHRGGAARREQLRGQKDGAGRHPVLHQPRGAQRPSRHPRGPSG
jgi:repressor LexA